MIKFLKKIISIKNAIDRVFRIFIVYTKVKIRWSDSSAHLIPYGFSMLEDGRIIKECSVSYDISSAANRANIKGFLSKSYELEVANAAQLFKLYDLDNYVDVTYDNVYFSFSDDEEAFNNGNNIIINYNMLFVPNSEIEPFWDSYKLYKKVKVSLFSAVIALIFLIIILVLYYNL